MVVVPPETPVTVPLVEPILATDVVLLLHTPPVLASESVVLLVPHTLNVPVMGDTAGLTTTVDV